MEEKKFSLVMNWANLSMEALILISFRVPDPDYTCTSCKPLLQYI